MRVKILEKATITHALFFFSFYYKFSYLAFSDLMLVNFDPFSTFLLVAGSRSGWGFLLIEWNSLASSNLLVPFHLLFQHSQAWFAVFILPQRDIGGHQCGYTNWNWGIINDAYLGVWYHKWWDQRSLILTNPFLFKDMFIGHLCSFYLVPSLGGLRVS
jgi:hypothetical protein